MYFTDLQSAIDKMNELGSGYAVVMTIDWYHHVDYHVIKIDEFRESSQNGESPKIVARFE
jgi:hypothetical protein